MSNFKEAVRPCGVQPTKNMKPAGGETGELQRPKRPIAGSGKTVARNGQMRLHGCNQRRKRSPQGRSVIAGRMLPDRK
jgi:hypothetical protein